MKTFRLILALILSLPVLACNAQSTENTSATSKTGKVEAYYFHFNARCITCRTVESEAKADIETLYPELIKSGKISFQTINLDDPSGKAIAEKLGVDGQSLLLVKDSQKINLITEGFMYARTNPEKFKAIIKEKVDGLLKM
jgi:hypothetical protein